MTKSRSQSPYSFFSRFTAGKLEFELEDSINFEASKHVDVGTLTFIYFRPLGRGGAMGASAPPLQAIEVHIFADQRFGRLELDTLLKDHDDQQC